MFRQTLSATLMALTVTAIGLVSSPQAGAAEAASIAVRDGLVWADVDCGAKTLHFVVDTGAASSCINLAAAKRLGLRLGAAIDVAGVDGRTTGYRCAGFQASVGGMRLPQDVVALDLSGPSRACSQAIDGLIGSDFFQGKVVRIDYAHGVLSRQGRLATGSGGTRMRVVNGVMSVPVALNGGEARWARVDTGCTEALIWCDGADCCCPADGGTKRTAGKSVALAASMGSAKRAEVTVGTAQLHGVPVKLHNREIFPGEAGLLGNAALSKYCVTIDGIGERLVLER
jgi:hypothetical protein